MDSYVSVPLEIRLNLRLLGGFVLERNNRTCVLAYEKSRALLAYLVCHATKEQSRSDLAALLWPELGRTASLANLRLVLHDLRRALHTPAHEAPPLLIDRDAIAFDPSAPVEIDAADFVAHAPSCPSVPAPNDCASCTARMENLVALYRGDFLAGFSLAGCTEFDEWLQTQREDLRLRMLQLLTRLSECHERTGAYARALPFAQRFLDMEPWNEEGLRRAMRLLALNGQSATALVEFEASRQALLRELGVPPAQETLQLAERIRRGELSPTTRRRGDTVPATGSTQPEQRLTTVMYCTLQPVRGGRPEADLELLREPMARCRTIVREYAGHCCPIHGSGFLAYFGAPLTDAQTAQRAVEAGLAIVDNLPDSLAARIGIQSGTMLVGSDPRLPDASGMLSDQALRIGQRCLAGEVAIGAATQTLVSGRFSCKSPQQGMPGDPATEAFTIAARRLCSADPPRSALPLVGRRNELDLLRALSREVRKGGQRCVLLRGEVGIGKSRLAMALKDRLRGEGWLAWELLGQREYRQSPFQPLAVLLSRLLEFAPQDLPEARFDQLAQFVETHEMRADTDTVALLASLLDLPLRPPYRPMARTDLQLRVRCAIQALLSQLASKQRVVLIGEDLQWADPSTLEFIGSLVVEPQPYPLLILLTARSGYRPAWENSIDRVVDLAALDDSAIAELVAGIAPQIDPAANRHLLARADGIPLFAEELARAMTQDVRAFVPASLQDLLAAHLDAEGQAKSIAQRAAVVGREFDLDLLGQISPCDNATLTRLLRQLENGGILNRNADAGYRFRQTLMHDVAYQSIDREERQAIHLRIAAALAAHRRTRPELLAQHWSAGGNPRQAISCWLAAGKQALRHSASHEAVAHYRAGLACLGEISDTQESRRCELELQIGLGAAATATGGYASAEAAGAYARALALCKGHAGTQETFPAVWGLWASASSRDGYPSALLLSRRLLSIAEQGGDAVELQQARFAMANTLFWQGSFARSRNLLEQVFASYRSVDHERHIALFGEDAGVTSSAYLSWVLWFAGAHEAALAASLDSVALARRLDHRFSLGYALTFAALLRCRLRRPADALPLARETLEIAQRHEFPLWRIGATIAEGWALAQQGETRGIAQLRECIGATQEAMGGVALIVLEPLIEACVLTGDLAQARKFSAQAQRIGAALGDHHSDAELCRLRGEAELGRARPDRSMVADWFRKALAISRRQGALALELRAATSMARMLAECRGSGAARRLLNGVCERFPLDCEVADLVEARRLLVSLSAT